MNRNPTLVPLATVTFTTTTTGSVHCCTTRETVQLRSLLLQLSPVQSLYAEQEGRTLDRAAFVKLRHWPCALTEHNSTVIESFAGKRPSRSVCSSSPRPQRRESINMMQMMCSFRLESPSGRSRIINNKPRPRHALYSIKPRLRLLCALSRYRAIMVRRKLGISEGVLLGAPVCVCVCTGRYCCLLPQYHPGFGSEISSEALPNALPKGQVHISHDIYT